MKRCIFLPCAGALTLLALAARPAFALWRLAQVTANGVYDGQQITVKASQEEKFTRFEVRVAPQPRAVSPFMTGQLSLVAQDKWVASVPVSEQRDNGAVTYTFRVAPETVAQSTLELHASLYMPAQRAKSVFKTAMLGNQKVEQWMGGTIYELKLKDFAGDKPR